MEVQARSSTKDWFPPRDMNPRKNVLVEFFFNLIDGSKQKIKITQGLRHQTKKTSEALLLRCYNVSKIKQEAI